jgi:hypothetical protein
MEIMPLMPNGTGSAFRADSHRSDSVEAAACRQTARYWNDDMLNNPTCEYGYVLVHCGTGQSIGKMGIRVTKCVNDLFLHKTRRVTEVGSLRMRAYQVGSLQMRFNKVGAL